MKNLAFWILKSFFHQYFSVEKKNLIGPIRIFFLRVEPLKKIKSNIVWYFVEKNCRFGIQDLWNYLMSILANWLITKGTFPSLVALASIGMISTDSFMNLEFRIYKFFSRNITQCSIWFFSTIQLGEKLTRKLVDHKGHLPIPRRNGKYLDDLHRCHVCIRSFFGKYCNFDPSTHHGNWKKEVIFQKSCSPSPTTNSELYVQCMSSWVDLLVCRNFEYLLK